MTYPVRHIPRTIILFIGYAVTLLAAPLSSAAQEGRISNDIVHSKALEGNQLGDSPDRSVLVYLPPSYGSSPDRRYPVVYLLHGNGAHNFHWINGAYQGMNIKTSLDLLIATDRIRELIVVMPDVHNRFRGSHYVNSSTTGNWADFITQDLVQYIDSTYRTIPDANGRGLSGHSMGGRGTLYLAISNPGIYGAIYGLSSGEMGFSEKPEMPDNPQWWSRLLTLQDLAKADSNMVRMIGLAAAFSPNPDRPPFYVDFRYQLVDGNVVPRNKIWRKWLAFDPVALVPSHTANLRSLRGIRFDSGLSDEIRSNSRAFARALAEAGIPHAYDEYDGDHSNRIRERIESHVLPFFSHILE